ncbi:MAG: RNA-binding S4 domain-containing protein [Clostridiales bacterium]|nr:RNA-binding S4 domain-containing protein [Clostridiales bacterium]HOC07997.1 RNA-binding S4 domain-containing protein [Bacillota bacterium]HQD41466.1 RNA-binding S4 domain-containing protein [Bacillota bacterium]
MRLDKFLKESRLIKRRTVAKEACDRGRILQNGKMAKAGSEVKPGDVLELAFGEKRVRVRVLDLIENAGKDRAREMYELME